MAATHADILLRAIDWCQQPCRLDDKILVERNLARFLRVCRLHLENYKLPELRRVTPYPKHTASVSMHVICIQPQLPPVARVAHHLLYVHILFDPADLRIQQLLDDCVHRGDRRNFAIALLVDLPLHELNDIRAIHRLELEHLCWTRQEHLCWTTDCLKYLSHNGYGIYNT